MDKSYNSNIYDSWEDEFVADIMNKLSPIKNHIEISMDEDIPIELRLKTQEVSDKAFNYIVDKLNEFRGK